MCALRPEFAKWFKPRDFDLRDEKVIMEVKNRIMSNLLETLALQKWFEKCEGGVQAEAVTKLAVIILDRLRGEAYGRDGAPLIQVNINQQIAEEINNLDVKTRKEIITILKKGK